MPPKSKKITPEERQRILNMYSTSSTTTKSPQVDENVSAMRHHQSEYISKCIANLDAGFLLFYMTDIASGKTTGTRLLANELRKTQAEKESEKYTIIFVSEFEKVCMLMEFKCNEDRLNTGTITIQDNNIIIMKYKKGDETLDAIDILFASPQTALHFLQQTKSENPNSPKYILVYDDPTINKEGKNDHLKLLTSLSKRTVISSATIYPYKCIVDKYLATYPTSTLLTVESDHKFIKHTFNTLPPKYDYKELSRSDAYKYSSTTLILTHDPRSFVIDNFYNNLRNVKLNNCACIQQGPYWYLNVKEACLNSTEHYKAFHPTTEKDIPLQNPRTLNTKSKTDLSYEETLGVAILTPWTKQSEISRILKSAKDGNYLYIVTNIADDANSVLVGFDVDFFTAIIITDEYADNCSNDLLYQIIGRVGRCGKTGHIWGSEATLSKCKLMKQDEALYESFFKTTADTKISTVSTVSTISTISTVSTVSTIPMKMLKYMTKVINTTGYPRNSIDIYKLPLYPQIPDLNCKTCTTKQHIFFNKTAFNTTEDETLVDETAPELIEKVEQLEEWDI